MSKAFTLIELLVVIAVLGVLAVGVLTAINITGNINKANLAKAKTFSASVENALSINQVGKWSFDDQTNPGKDTSGYGNDGTVTGDTWADAATCSLGFGGCLSFDGNDYVNITNRASAINNERGTLSFWFKSPTLPGNYYPFAYATSAVGSFTLILSKDTYTGQLENEVIIVQRYSDNGGAGGYTYFAYTTTANELYDSKWHFITTTFDGTTTKIYLDGNKKPITIAGGCCNQTNNGKFLGYTNPVTDVRIGDSVNGLMDEFAIYNQALTSYQIQELYAQGIVRHLLVQK